MASTVGTDVLQALAAMLQQVTHGWIALHGSEQTYEMAGRPARPLLARRRCRRRLPLLSPDAAASPSLRPSLLPVSAGGGAGRHRPRGSRPARGSAAPARRLGGGAGAGGTPRGAPTPSPAAGAAGRQPPGGWQLAALRPSRHAAADGWVSSGRGCRGLWWGVRLHCRRPAMCGGLMHRPLSLPLLSPAWRGGYLAWSTGWRSWIKGPKRCCRPAQAAGWACCRCANGCVCVAAWACTSCCDFCCHPTCNRVELNLPAHTPMRAPRSRRLRGSMSGRSCSSWRRSKGQRGGRRAALLPRQQPAGQQTGAPRSCNLGSMRLAYKSLHICTLCCGAPCC